MTLTPLQKANAKRLEMRESGIEPERLDPLQKAQRNPQSLRLAITAKCWDCVGRDADPNTRQRIRECGITGCPLYPLRPYQSAKSNDYRSK